MSRGKKALIIILSFLCIICIGIDVWCVCVYQFGDEKTVSNTFNIGEMSTIDGSDKKTIWEINYYSNKNQNGLELFEIKYNDFADETLTAFVSVGSQYVADSISDSIKWEDMSKLIHQTKVLNTDRWGIFNAGKTAYTNAFFSTTLKGNSSYYEYQSANDYDFSIGNDINALSGNTTFKVTIGEDIYQLGFKGNVAMEDFYLGEYRAESIATIDVVSCYSYIDHNLLARVLYNMCQNATIGTNCYETLQVGDLFNYKIFNGKTYTKIEDKDTKVVKQEVNNNYAIKIHISEDGATKASDSMFNQIHGDSTFNLTGDVTYEDYLYGKSVIDVDIDDFDKILYKDGYYMFTLSEDFIKAYEEYSKSIVLRVNIDTTKLNSNIKFLGLTSDWYDEFDVYECVIDGVSISEEVA